MTRCQHSRYSFILLNGVRHAQCQDCSGQWLIALGSGGDGTTDMMANTLSGVAARAKGNK